MRLGFRLVRMHHIHDAHYLILGQSHRAHGAKVGLVYYHAADRSWNAVNYITDHILTAADMHECVAALERSIVDALSSSELPEVTPA